uniref:Uncharacterized protein n=1 Tax=Entomoneis paludosa TaxID=265537 RepID=A0A7S2YCT7_9STRA|mmetsp:Transcript_27639/g.57835  ORF Transcript_27639/g.57835 Transcript_27639/m.57835 type:complete len:127 (+) Transcript_27639:377-757(+)
MRDWRALSDCWMNVLDLVRGIILLEDTAIKRFGKAMSDYAKTRKHALRERWSEECMNDSLENGEWNHRMNVIILCATVDGFHFLFRRQEDNVWFETKNKDRNKFKQQYCVAFRLHAALLGTQMEQI